MEQPVSSTTTDAGDLQQELNDLRRRTMVLYLALAVLSMTLAGFIGLQQRRASKDLQSISPQATAVLEANRKNSEAVSRFLSQLEAYGRTHSNFQQRVLARYPINRTGEAPAATGAAALPEGAALPK